MCKKYEICENTKTTISLFKNKYEIYRIKSLIDFYTPDRVLVRKGDLGGWIQSEENLSQEDTCWIFDDSKVLDTSVIKGHSVIMKGSIVYNASEVFNYNIKTSSINNSTISSASRLNRDIISSYIEKSTIDDSNIEYSDLKKVYSRNNSIKNILIESSEDELEICDSAISGFIVSRNNYTNLPCIYAKHGGIIINSRIQGKFSIDCNYIEFIDNFFTVNLQNLNISTSSIKITNNQNILIFTGFGHVKRTTYSFMNHNDEILVSCGCFMGTLEEFRSKIWETYPDESNKFHIEYLLMVDMIEAHFCN